MPGLNTAGTADTNNYNLGRGKLYAAELDTDGKPKGFRDLGNAKEFNISIESETLPHQSSRSGLKVTDKEVVISQSASLSLTLDEINFENVALFMSGSTASFTNGAAAGAVTIPGAKVSGKGFWHDLVDSAGARIYDVDSIAFDTVTHTIAGTVGTDFLLDKVMGRVFIPTTTNLTAVAAGSILKYTPTYGGSRKATLDEVRALTTTSKQVALKFISENPAYGDHQTEYLFHKVTLKAEGDFSLIGDDWTEMPLTGAAEKNEAASVTSPTCTIRTYDGGVNQ